MRYLSSFRVSRALCLAAIITCGSAIPCIAKTSAYSSDTKISKVLQSDANDVGMPVQYPHAAHPEVSVIRVTLLPGKTTGWHLHPVQGVAYVLTGILTVRSKGYPTHVFHAGQSFAESIGILHEGANEGKQPVEMIVVFLGEKGRPFAVKPKARTP
jgi:quercetin dioxygenase-like cupin family protein